MIIIAGLFLFRAPIYAPDTEFIPGGFNSDSAIPVLMANSDYFSPFSLYYWGQDRFGAWPFLMLRLLPEASEFHVFLAMFVYLHAGLLVFFWNRNPLSFVSTLTLLHAWQGASGYLFDIAQPYGWQLGSILITLSCMELTARNARTARRLLSGPGLCTTLFAFLAIWLSPSSILYFLGYPIFRLAPTGSLSSLVARIPASRMLQLWFPTLTAYLAHSLLRKSVVAYNSDVFYHAFETPLEWESKFIEPAWKALIQSLAVGEIGVWATAIIVLSFLTLAFVLGMEKTVRFVRKYPMEINLLAGGLLFILALLPLNWFYLNQFGIRYLAIPRFFMAVGFLLLLLNIASDKMKQHFQLAEGFAIPALLLAVAFQWMPQVLPNRKASAAYQERKRVAEYLEGNYPGVPILGNYWETYVYAALQKDRNLPQPGTGQYQRTPFLLPHFLESSRIIVNHRGYERTTASDGKPLSRFRFRSQEYELIKRFHFRGIPFSIYQKVH